MTHRKPIGDDSLIALCKRYSVQADRIDRNAVASARAQATARIEAEGASAERAIAYSSLAEQSGNFYLAAEWAAAASAFDQVPEQSTAHEERAMRLITAAIDAQEKIA